MNFGFSPEQEQLRDQVRRFLDAECPMDRVRRIMASREPHDDALWSKMAGLGWQGIAISADHDGLGLAWEDVVVVAEELGRRLCPSPLLASAAAARAIGATATPAQAARWLPALAAGRSIAVLAVLEESDDLSSAGIAVTATRSGDSISLSGKKTFVPYGQAADLLLVAAREEEGISLFTVPAHAPGIAIAPLRLFDQTSRAAEITLADVRVQPSDRLATAGEAWAAIEAAGDAATVALAAEMVGAADAALGMAVEYAKVRKQFGEPIGKFQGVKHRLAEILVDIESARSLVYYASWAVDHLQDARAAVSMAKAYASTALDRAGEECIQIHGAIGFTWECDAHLFYKRGRYCRSLGGSPEYHHERLLSVQGL